jgi:hypothetical protein
MVLAMVFGVIALSSFAFAVYVRLQPPTVIRELSASLHDRAQP